MSNVLGIGVDLVDLRRIRMAAHRPRVAQYVFLDEELEEMKQSRDEVEFLASRLATKEAVIKAAPMPLTFQDFAIVKERGKPSVRFLKPEHQQYNFFISLSHAPDHAVACAVLVA